MKRKRLQLLYGSGDPAAFRRLCVETPPLTPEQPRPHPAAFRRLCVETWLRAVKGKAKIQPPSGGCVLKLHHLAHMGDDGQPAAFRRLCVETSCLCGIAKCANQPPSGGCVLKPRNGAHGNAGRQPAAFRRLCVETRCKKRNGRRLYPAAFRRLCVETASPSMRRAAQNSQPPSGGCVLKLDVVPLKSFANEPAAFRRLCVETTLPVKQPRVAIPAAFRRLCVETSKRHLQIARMTQPPSGGCVLKQPIGWKQAKGKCPAAFRRLCVETKCRISRAV